MIKLEELRDIGEARVSVTVNDPVPTLRGPKKIDSDEDVTIEIEFGPAVNVEVVVPAAHYLRILKAVEERKRLDAVVL